MAYCVKCGSKVNDGTTVCPQCGADIPYADRAYQEAGQGRQSCSQNDAYGQSQDTYGQGYTYRQEQQDNSQGYAYSQSQQNNQQGGYQQYHNYQGPGYFDYNEVHQNKLMGVLSYLGILVAVPLLAGDKTSEYVRFHANQGLLLFIASAVVALLSGGRIFGLHSFINFGNTWFGWIFDLCKLVLFVFAIVGIVHACKGERKELPIIGQFRILR